uniref:Uncharacterized protein n=1 Tax=Octopus bimaculoides TaxID=37653 RepID=A0A0L8G0F3_OCTBM
MVRCCSSFSLDFICFIAFVVSSSSSSSYLLGRLISCLYLSASLNTENSFFVLLVSCGYLY